jgi:hypothetical protein
MLPVLDLDPAVRSTAVVWAVTVFRDKALQAHRTGMPEQVRTDLALLEGC